MAVFLKASCAVTVNWNLAPVSDEEEAAETDSWVAGPALTGTPFDVPVSESVPVAVTV